MFSKSTHYFCLLSCLFIFLFTLAKISYSIEKQIDNSQVIGKTYQHLDFYNNILSKEERLWLQQHKIINLGVDPSWPPFEFFDQHGKYSGVASGYIKILNEMLGIEFKPLLNQTWSAVVSKAKKGEVDVLPAVGITPERLQYLNFTQSYITFPTVIVTREIAPFLGNINDLVNLKVGVVENYITHENLKRDYPNLNLVTLNTIDEALIALSNGAIDAFVDNLAAITYGMSKLQLENLKIAAPTEYTFELHMGVRQDWKELIPILNKALINIPNFKRSAIQNEWVSIYVNLGVRMRTVALWITPVLLGFLIVLFIWNRRLKSEIAERRVTEFELKKLSTAIEQSPVSILITDPQGYIEYSNPRFELVSGYTAGELIGKHSRLFKTENTAKETYEQLWKTINGGKIWVGEFYNRKKNGDFYWEHTSICPIKNEANEIINFIAVKEDITQRKMDETLIHKQATTDALTGLANRKSFLDRLTDEISHCKRSGEYIAVMFIDLDRFKNINDSRGHSVGDKFLIEIGNRLNSCLRGDDIVARFGGDEFVIMLRDLKNVHNPETIAKKLQESLAKPIIINSVEIYVSCSIGIALYPMDGTDSETLILHADMAMYRTKELGRNNFHFYSEALHKEAVAHAELELQLHIAVDNEELLVYYQPIVSLEENSIQKVEALVRWNHPEHGILAPDKFISIAEETGLIVKIGEYVLKQACIDFNEFRSFSKSISNISINCSPEQFQHKDFQQMFEQIINETGLSTAQVILEITENLFINAEDSLAVATLVNLRQAGVQIALDDFGTGFSSLSYLRRFPVDIIKIDKSFIRDIVEDPNDYRLVDTIIRMGHALDLTVVAEGIESVESANLLSKLKCEFVQGYFYGRPLPKGEFIKLLT